MKSLLLFLLTIPFLSFSQSSLDKMLTISSADSNRAKITVSGKMFEMISYAAPDTLLTEDVLKLSKSIHGIKAYTNLSVSTGKRMMEGVAKNKQFEEYARYSQKGNEMALFIAEKDGVVKEVLMFYTTEKNANVASVYGELDLKLIGNLYKLLPMHGFNTKAPADVKKK